MVNGANLVSGTLFLIRSQERAPVDRSRLPVKRRSFKARQKLVIVQRVIDINWVRFSASAMATYNPCGASDCPTMIISMPA